MSNKFPPPRKPKNNTTPVAHEGSPDVLPNDVPGVIAESPTSAPGEAQVSGAPVQADDTVTLKKDDLAALLDARVKQAVEAALAVRSAEATVRGEAAPTSEGLEERIAKSVAMVLVANQQAQASNAVEQQLAMARARDAKHAKCHICGQSILACGGPWKKATRKDEAQDRDGYLLVDGRRYEDPTVNHIKMVVFPKSDENAEWFTGVRVNGKLYLSNGPGHEIWVPAKNDIAAILAEFENGERRSRTPRKHVRQFGGTVNGNGGANVVPMHFTH